MNLCQPHEPGTLPVVVRPLSFQERRAVIGSLLGTGAAHPAALLKAIHDAHHWIACDCLGDRPPPVIHTRRSAGGHYALVRMPGRPPHAPGCPVADGLSDLYEDTLTPVLATQLRDIAEAASASRVWHANKPSSPPTVWTMLSTMARHAASINPPTGQVITHPSRLAGLAVRLRQEAAATGAPQIATALLVTRRTDRGSVSPLAKDAAPVHVRGPIVELGQPSSDSPSISILRIAKGTDGRYEPIAAVAAQVSKSTVAITPTPASVEVATLMVAVGRTLRSVHHIEASIDLTFPSGLDQAPEVRVQPASGTPLTLSVGRPSSTSNLYILLTADRRPSVTYHEKLAGYIADRLNQAATLTPVRP